MKNIPHFVVILIGVLVALLLIYRHFTSFYIVAKFKELRPHMKNMPVYYKGLKIGRAHKVRHSKDLAHTYMDIVISKKGMMLPINSTVLLKKEKRNKKEKDFLEIIYPKEPEKLLLSKGSEIKGIATVDVEEYLSNQHPDELEEIKKNLLESSENLEYMLSSIGFLCLMISWKKIEEISKKQRIIFLKQAVALVILVQNLIIQLSKTNLITQLKICIILLKTLKI